MIAVKNDPLVSVIIVNYNGKEHLEKCLESLSKVNYNKFEIIIVDNNSIDGSIEFLMKNYPSIIIIKLDENKGFAEPNNIAAKIAKGDYLLFLNNDTIVTSNFISEMINVIENDDEIAICQSLLLKPDGSIDSSGDFIDELGVVYSSKIMTKIVRNISSPRAASMLVKKNIFKELEGFDEKFFASFEDVDLGWRTWIAGYKIKLVPSSIVYHLGGKTIEKIKSEVAFHGFKNQLSMKITNFEYSLAIKNMIKFFIIYGLRELRIWFDYKLYGKTFLPSTKYENNIAPNPNFKVIVKSIWWIICNQKYLMTKHHKVNSQRKITTNQLKKMNVICDFSQ